MSNRMFKYLVQSVWNEHFAKEYPGKSFIDLCSDEHPGIRVSILHQDLPLITIPLPKANHVNRHTLAEQYVVREIENGIKPSATLRIIEVDKEQASMYIGSANTLYIPESIHKAGEGRRCILDKKSSRDLVIETEEVYEDIKGEVVHYKSKMSIPWWPGSDLRGKTLIAEKKLITNSPFKCPSDLIVNPDNEEHWGLFSHCAHYEYKGNVLSIIKASLQPQIYIKINQAWGLVQSFWVDKNLNKLPQEVVDEYRMATTILQLT